MRYSDRKAVVACSGGEAVGVFPSIRQAGWYMYRMEQADNLNSASANICRACRTGKNAFGYCWRPASEGDGEAGSSLSMTVEYRRMLDSGEIPSGNPARKSNRMRAVVLYRDGAAYMKYRSISAALRGAAGFIPEGKLDWLRFSLNGYFDNTGITEYSNYRWVVGRNG